MRDIADSRSYLVECYWPGVSHDKLVSMGNRALAASEELRRQGRDVALVEAILVPADETVFCLFTGCERDVRTVSARAGVPLERLVEFMSLRAAADGSQQPGGQRSADEHC